MRKTLLCLSLVAAVVALPGAGFAFGTVSKYVVGAGQDREHERITRAALKALGVGPKTIDEAAGKLGTWGAVGSPDNPTYGLMSAAAAHCDGGDHLDVAGYPQSAAAARQKLEACRAWMVDHLEAAVVAAGGLVDAGGRIEPSQAKLDCPFNGKPGRAKCDALEALGVALHASEDFYSHSNWTDQAAPGPVGPSNPPGLGRTGRAPWLEPGSKTAFPAGLMTGCYEGFPESRHCTYGDGIARVRHDNVNKDKGTIRDDGSTGEARTARGKVGRNFDRAVAAAMDDTRNKWGWFEAQVRARYGAARGGKIVCVMRSDDVGKC